MGVFGDLLVFIASPKRRRKLGSYCISFSIAVSFLGYDVVILMRYFLTMRRKGGQEQKVVC
jgi:hypothetical protein